jgi:hypothetical protein
MDSTRGIQFALDIDNKATLGEVVDQLTTLDPLHDAQWRNVISSLYDAARDNCGGPLSVFAAERLIQSVRPGDFVIITTGWIIEECMEGETDGPIGAVSLARAISVGLQATPVIVCEESQVDILSEVSRAAGLHVYDVAEAKKYPGRVAILSFPSVDDEAKRESARLLNELKPSAIIAIEKPSRNEKGVYHGARDTAVSFHARVDYLFDDARSRNILTVGIGDHGGEIGMGNILDTVKRVVGTKCKCPCGSGIAGATKTDILIVGTSSNWGAYGLETCLAALLGREEVLHDSAAENRMLEAAVKAGAVDGSRETATGLGEPVVDGYPKKFHIFMIEMLQAVLLKSLSRQLQQPIDPPNMRNIVACTCVNILFDNASPS